MNRLLLRYQWFKVAFNRPHGGQQAVATSSIIASTAANSRMKANDLSLHNLSQTVVGLIEPVLQWFMQRHWQRRSRAFAPCCIRNGAMGFCTSRPRPGQPPFPALLRTGVDDALAQHMSLLLINAVELKHTVNDRSSDGCRRHRRRQGTGSTFQPAVVRHGRFMQQVWATLTPGWRQRSP